MTGTAGPAPGRQVDGLATGMIRVALLVRQLALAAAALAILLRGPSVLDVLVVLALLVTSQAGLHSVRVLQLVERHPSLALVDVLLVAAATAALGPRHPVVLATLTSALIIGVLFRRRTSPLLVAVLLTGHLLSLRGEPALTVNDMIGMPVAIVSVAAVGLGFRLLVEQAQQSERRLAEARRTAAAAEERLRLARDVHDTVAKSVQGVALLASSLPQWIERDTARAVAHADLVAASARDAVREARALLSDLRSAPDDGLLTDWLEGHVQAWAAGREAAVDTDLVDVPGLDPVVCREVRAAVHEALENVDRHAPDAAVRVVLDHLDDEVRLTVSDDGPGFDQARRVQALAADHYGLVGIEERLAAVGGRGEVRSAPGRGTQVSLVVPTGAAVLDLTRMPAPAPAGDRPAVVRGDQAAVVGLRVVR
ncbi:sensor histidine kinase [Aquipuribacter sp. MA13-6]|uniref:sensor histidine kinase n=1 Tax=unclassified Aquipuribacter TaxID=2635084 RepID=UPI003EE8E33B